MLVAVRSKYRPFSVTVVAHIAPCAPHAHLFVSCGGFSHLILIQSGSFTEPIWTNKINLVLHAHQCQLSLLAFWQLDYALLLCDVGHTHKHMRACTHTRMQIH